MVFLQKIKRTLSLLLVVAMVGGQAMPLQAAMVGTDTLIQQGQLQYDREQLVAMLDRTEVQQQLVELGVDTEAAKERVAQMTAEELNQLNAQLAEMPAGGDALGVVVLIFLVFVITDMLGATDIFPFIHPVR